MGLAPRQLGLVDYASTFAAMQEFTATRDAGTPDALWICEHLSVFTQGLAGKSDHLLNPGDIAVVQSDRGGQVTYHGPGQVVAYPLVDLRRLGIFVKEYVYRLETAVLQVLDSCGVVGHRVRAAPGIYVRLDDPFDHAPLARSALGADPFPGLGKIAALGVKVTRHCAYHGLALNVAMDLEPFSRINPCGHVGLRTVDLRSLGVTHDVQDMAARLARRLQALLAV
jgi:lipoyl(octanoyl) transferase